MFVVHAIGNLGRDATWAESKTTGKTYASFSLAVNNKFNGGEETTWMDVMVRTDNMDILNYLKKGKKVSVLGRGTLAIDTYNDKVSPRLTIWVELRHNLEFLSKVEDNEQ